MSRNPVLTIAQRLKLFVAAFLTGTQMIVARKRRGKSYLAQLQAEQLLKHRRQVIVLDPTDAWWGLRSSADGKSEGYPITIFGGRHGDLPLDPASGEDLARAICEEGFSAVLCLKRMKKGERLRFAADFMESLYQLAPDAERAMHLFIDEADVFAPQIARDPQQARLLGATDELVRRGGIDGVGVTLITQRSQVVNKDVMSQIDSMAVLQMNHPKDIDAVRDWMRANFANTQRIESTLASLPRLPVGEAWYLQPENDIFEHIHVNRKTTFDSGRTKGATGNRVAPPKRMAKIDLERLGAQIAARAAEARENDPKELKKKVAHLTTELAKAKENAMHQPMDARVSAATREPRIVEKRIIIDTSKLEKAISRADKASEKAAGVVDKAAEMMRHAADLIATSASGITGELAITRKAIEHVASQAAQAAATPRKKSKVETEGPKMYAETAAATNPRPIAQRYQPNTAVPPDPKRRAVPAGSDAPKNAAVDLDPRDLRVLGSIRWWESIGVAQPDNTQIAFVAGYSPSSTSYEKSRGKLRSFGLVTYPIADHAELTEEGRRRATAPPIDRTHAGLHAAFRARLEPRNVRLLDVLIERYPRTVTNGELATASGYSVTSTSYEKARGFLRSLGLAEYPTPGTIKATEILFPEGLK